MVPIIVFVMDKIANQRYASDHQIPLKKGLPSHRFDRTSHAATNLSHKQSQIDLVKKRISALSVRQQKYAHRTLNSDLQLQKKQLVQRESQRIQRLLQRQKQRQIQHLDLIKHCNLKTRADNYYRSKIFREKRMEEVMEKSVDVRSGSRSNHSTISQNRAQNVLAKKQRSREIYQSQKKAQGVRSRVLQQRREEAANAEMRESQHFRRIEGLRDHQLSQLGKLEFMMVEKSNTSRAALEASREKLISRTSISRFQTNHIIRTARQNNPSRKGFSLHIY